MQASMFQKLRAAVSFPRLDAYRSPGDSDFDVICKYLWNMDLCESLYPSLQTLEITLRNTIHQAATRRYRTEFWFNPTPGPGLLGPREQESIVYAKGELAKKAKPLEAPRVVAELTFGFWASLFDSRYEQVFWP